MQHSKYNNEKLNLN